MAGASYANSISDILSPRRSIDPNGKESKFVIKITEEIHGLPLKRLVILRENSWVQIYIFKFAVGK